MVVFLELELVGEADRRAHLDLVFRLVRPVPALALGLPELHRGQGFFPRQLFHIVGDAVVVFEFVGLELAPHLVAEHEEQPVVDHRLPF